MTADDQVKVQEVIAALEGHEWRNRVKVTMAHGVEYGYAVASVDFARRYAVKLDDGSLVVTPRDFVEFVNQ